MKGVKKVISHGKKSGVKTVEIITKNGETKHLHQREGSYIDKEGNTYKI